MQCAIISMALDICLDLPGNPSCLCLQPEAIALADSHRTIRAGPPPHEVARRRPLDGRATAARRKTMPSDPANSAARLPLARRIATVSGAFPGVPSAIG
jgi:hypothetical protein